MTGARTVRKTVGLLVVAFGLLGLAGTASASASVAWRIDALSDTTVEPGGTLTYLVQVTNVGADVTSGEYKVMINLPSGVTGVDAGLLNTIGEGTHWTCTAGDGSSPVEGASTILCKNSDGVNPKGGAGGRQSMFIVDVRVDPAAAGTLTSSFTIAEGGAASPAATSASTTVSPQSPPFGLAAFDSSFAADAAGSSSVQAGAHSYLQSTAVDFNTFTPPNPFDGPVWPVQAVKDVVVDLPAGFVAYPPAAAKCTELQLRGEVGGPTPQPLCPPSSQVGTSLVHLDGLGSIDVYGPVPVYDMVAPPGVPARFAFNLFGNVVTVDANVRYTSAGYAVGALSENIPEGLPVAGNIFTLWGVPSSPSHDGERACAGQKEPFDFEEPGPTCPSGAPTTAFLRNPTSCEPDMPGDEALVSSVHIDSWAEPGPSDGDGRPVLTDPRWQSMESVSHLAPGYPAPRSQWGSPYLPTDCARVPFTPTFKAEPQSPVNANAPTGFRFDVGLPQSSDPSAIGEGDLRKVIVTLPKGIRVSPSSAQGLEACSPEQIGLGSTRPARCPEASRIGSIKLRTPLLEQELQGSVYLATPHDNPFGSLVALYQVIDVPGFTIKLPGRVDLDPATGQITTTFDNLPQLPFEDLQLDLKSGPRSSLTTPTACGTYTTHAELLSWSGKTVEDDSSFTVEHGPSGGPCAAQGFGPGFSAGNDSPVAGAFSPFAMRLTRSDADSEFNALSLHLPPGLLADIGSVPVRCSNAQAAAAACPADSHLGTVTVGAGAGPNPFYVNGDVYLTGPYQGSPFGLAVVVRAVAGPFDLGTVVVRAGIQVHDDGSATVVTDPFPRILQGIPLQVRDIRVNVDRPNFTLNPTNCSVLSVGGVVSSTDGQSAGLGSRFQVGECAALGFHPSFRVSTQARTSKAQGASLDVKVGSGAGQANIAKAIVTLPKQLPARLTTIQQACAEAVFAVNPATCPAASAIGIATATTRILAGPVSGPAYLVSHGGAAFPDVVVILQGEGVTVHLVGGVNIRKGITTASFDSSPDVPIGVFEFRLPEGPHSGLAANLPARARGSMCGQSLSMPTTLVGQNGAQVKQNTKIAVTGCPRAKKAHKAVKKGKHAKGGKGRKK